LFSDDAVAVAVVVFFPLSGQTPLNLLGKKFISFGTEPSYRRRKALAGVRENPEGSQNRLFRFINWMQHGCDTGCLSCEDRETRTLQLRSDMPFPVK